MTHTPLTKAEREELRRMFAQVPESDQHPVPRLLADLDAAEAERDARGDEARELRSVLLRHNFAPCDTAACNCNGWHERSTGNGFYARFREIEEEVGEHDGQTLLDAVKQIVAERKAAVLWAEKAEKAMTCKGCGGTVSDHLAPDQGGCPGSFEIDGVQMVPLAGRNEVVAQRDRAESELDAERKMRVEAEAARDDARGELDDISSESGYAVSFDEEGHGDDRTLPEFVRDLAAERDALNNELCTHLAARNGLVGDGLIQTVETTACAVRRLTTERDALKAKLDDPRRVVIHETEVVATKEEIATLRSERDMFANWIAMEHRAGPDWACAQCKPPTHGNYMVVEGFVCIRHRAMAIAAARGGAK